MELPKLKIGLAKSKQVGGTQWNRAAFPVATGLVVIAVLLSLGLTQFLLKGYLAQDGYAVPRDTLSTLLRENDDSEIVDLIQVHAGEAIYTSAVGGSRGYFIGEGKVSVSSGYPLYTREGQVLYFMNDSLRMVTEEWTALSSYEGLYLSDGVTYNADRSQADIQRILLVQVDGGYQVAQDTTASSGGQRAGIPMNSICSFGERLIVYYSYQDGILVGSSIRMGEGATISIGDNTYDYLDFLKRLGLWEEQPVREPGLPTPPEPPKEPEDEDKDKNKHSDTNAPVAPPAPAESAAPGVAPEKSPRPPRDNDQEPAEGTAPTRPSGTASTPAAPQDGSNSTPQAPEAATKPPKDPNYVKPTVSFSGLKPWVYTITTQASISDPAQVIKNGGVQIYVYQVDGDKETLVLRQTATRSGEVVLGQVRPSTKFHVIAEYEYKNADGYNEKETIDLGEVTTLGFETLGAIRISLRDETVQNEHVTVENRVRVYGKRLQARDIAFDNIRNNQTVEPNATVSYSSANLNTAERYVNSFVLNVTPRSGGDTVELRMENQALRLMCEGYTLAYWNTPERLKSGTEYVYTLTLQDRYGNTFKIEPDKEYYGHTCKADPSVTIRVPEDTNEVNSTQINVTWRNEDLVEVGADASENAPMGNTMVAGLYLVKDGDETNTPVELKAESVDGRQKVQGKFLPISYDGKTSITQWVIKDLEPYTAYTAYVMCGHYDIGNGEKYNSVTLNREYKFYTVALRSKVSYTTKVDQITENNARLTFRMNEMDAVLPPLLDQITFTLRAQADNSIVGRVSLCRDDLSKIPFDALHVPDGGKAAIYTVPVHWEQDDRSGVRYTALSLLWSDAIRPVMPDGGSVQTVWDFLVATSVGKEDNCCWASLDLGGAAGVDSDGTGGSDKLFFLKPSTRYKGDFSTEAKLGNMTVDVTNTSSPSVYFQTVSQEAVVHFDNAFVSDEFIELYGLSIYDYGKCIQPDAENRGGNIAVRVHEYDPKALTPVGRLVTYRYIDSEKYLKDASEATGPETPEDPESPAAEIEPLRLSNLVRGKTYALVFYAQRYDNGVSTVIEQDRPLKYMEPQPPQGTDADPWPADATWYIFTTGNSVTGKLELQGISQQYHDMDGSVVSSLGMLNDNDFYWGIWQYDSRLFYRDDKPADKDLVEGKVYDRSGIDALKRYLEEFKKKETQLDPKYWDQIIFDRLLQDADMMGLTADQKLKLEQDRKTLDDRQRVTGDLWKYMEKGEAPNKGTHVLSLTPYSPTNTANVWTTRFIKVNPGEMYCIYNNDITGLRITFFYEKNGDGLLRHYTTYDNACYSRGGVFMVPQAADPKNVVCYMVISGTNRRATSTMVLDRYDPHMTDRQPNLGKGVALTQGVSLSQSGAQSVDATGSYGFVSGYIPVRSGSVYELKNRDINRPDDPKSTSEAHWSMQNNSTFITEDTVLFYDSTYGFLGGYVLSNQTSLIKAPFGAAYCRFTIRLHKDGDKVTCPEWGDGEHDMSIREYVTAVEGEYSATIKAALKDDSDLQILRGGTYTVQVYESTSAVSDSDDLSALSSDAWQDFFTQTYPADYTGKLDLERIVSIPRLPSNRGFRARLLIRPEGWVSQVVLDTIYFTSNRVVVTINNVNDLMAITNNPAGSYLVTSDIPNLNATVLSDVRPFTGTIDFQGHKVTMNAYTQMFYRISKGGVVKNLEFEYTPKTTADSYKTNMPNNLGAIAYNNYGTIQNVVVRYGPSNETGYSGDINNAGGICRNNYGVIDGFVVEFQKDVRVTNNFGAVCVSNSGEVCNGYVTGVELNAGQDKFNRIRRATVIHSYRDALSGNVMNADAQYISLGVSSNGARGVVRNMYIVNDLIIESAVGDGYTSSTGDYDKNMNVSSSMLDPSTTNCYLTALGVANSSGIVEDVYTMGDRWDYGEDGRHTIMKERGPVVTNIGGVYSVNNVHYLSDEVYNTLGTDKYTYNIHDESESLYDYKWHESFLGTDGTRFTIREMLERPEGACFPQLILPDCFRREGVTQPVIPLSGRGTYAIKILFNEVRLKGLDQALVTVGFNNPTQAKVQESGFVIFDGTNLERADALNCEVLDQRLVGDVYRVDVLISPKETNVLKGEYTIDSVVFSSGPVPAYDTNGERIIHTDFWREINDLEDWSNYFTGGTITGNYLLTADLDFSKSRAENTSDTPPWYVANEFKGVLNGGIYALREVDMTNSIGQVITTASGEPRTMSVPTSLIGMHTISGVGNMDRNGDYDPLRAKNNNDFTSSLFRTVSGTLENLVFQDFESVLHPDDTKTKETTAQYAGVIVECKVGAVLENCHVRDSNFYGRMYMGALVGSAKGTAITNCSVARTRIETQRRAGSNDTVSVGGLVGYLESGSMENCFADSVQVTVGDVYNTYGVGGLAGYINASSVQSCYATGTVDHQGEKNEISGMVDSSASRVGGLVGRMTGASAINGCWTTTTVMTAADYAGGLLGYFEDGIIANNYTASTLITRALEATSVHRICNNIYYDEVKRRENYAFEGQYITYYNPDPGMTSGDTDPTTGKPVGVPVSKYQFGIWDELDGATALLTLKQLREAETWTGIIGVSGESFDLMGSAGRVPFLERPEEGGVSFSGGTAVNSAVVQGQMPKLRHTETGVLLYDQQGSDIGYASNTLLTRISIVANAHDQTFDVRLVLYSLREDIQALFEKNVAGKQGFIESKYKDRLARWDKMTVIGADLVGEVELPQQVFTPPADMQAIYKRGQEIKFTVAYGDREVDGKTKTGHYMDSYTLTLPIYIRDPWVEDPSMPEGGYVDTTTPTEVIQVRLGQNTDDPFYKRIGTMDEWNNFFKMEEHINFYENVQIEGDLTFTQDSEMNVKLNRLDGLSDGTQHTITSEKQELKFTKSDSLNLISQVTTQVSNITFKDLYLSSTELNDGITDHFTPKCAKAWKGGDNKGVVGLLQGSLKNVTFENVRVDGGYSSYVGMVGQMYGWARNVTLRGVEVISRDNCVGGLAGYATAYASIGNPDEGTDFMGVRMEGLPLDDGTVQKNRIASRYGSYVGGVVGQLNGVATNLRVADTEVYGRYCVGGAIGYANTNANKPGEDKVSDVVIGYGAGEEYAAVTRKPGVKIDDKGDPDPSVIVRLEARSETGNATFQFAGGAIGHGNNQQLRNIRVYNTWVEDIRPENHSIATNINSVTPSYNGYTGGIVGYDGGYLQESTAENCTVVTHRSRAGGVSGSSVSYYNRAIDCVVYSTEKDCVGVGGINGIGYAHRCIADHCVISGYRGVGGVSGASGNSNISQSGAVDCAVLGVSAVGGIGGLYGGDTMRSVYVTTSEPGVFSKFTLTKQMLSPLMQSYEDTEIDHFTIESTENGAGGLVGTYRGRLIYDTSVSKGVTVKGKEYVGGLVGEYYGWIWNSWAGNDRSLYTSMTAATVEGKRYIGGAIGYYTMDWVPISDPDTNNVRTYRSLWKYMPVNLHTAAAPNSGYFYGLMVACDSITGEEHVDALMGGKIDLDRYNFAPAGTTMTADQKKEIQQLKAYTLGESDLSDVESTKTRIKLTATRWQWVEDSADPKKSGYKDVTVPRGDYSLTLTDTTFNGCGYFGYCRIWDGCKIEEKGVPQDLSSLLTYRQAVSGIKGEGSIDYTTYWRRQHEAMKVTAEDINDPNLYFFTRTRTAVSGMGWSRSVWSEDIMTPLYAAGADSQAPGGGNPVGIPAGYVSATFDAYKKGLEANGESAPVLWLDARNNTGEGHTDEDAVVWKDLSATGNDAVLHWNKKPAGGEETHTIDERTLYMYWRNGALEFRVDSADYYAKFKDNHSLSQTMNGGEYTVELIYSYVDPYPATYYERQFLSWRYEGTNGGFYTLYSLNNNSTNAYIRDFNSSGTIRNLGASWVKSDETTGKEWRNVNREYMRSAAFVIKTEKDKNGADVRNGSYYLNGVEYGTFAGVGTVPDELDMLWVIGKGNWSQTQTRVCGVRVYDKALTPEQVKAHSDYDMWYYFDGAAPAGAAAPRVSLTLDTEGRTSGGAGACQLYRSDSPNYNGTLLRTYNSAGELTENYESGRLPLGSRGYYYVKSGGEYSPLVEVNDTSFGPRLRTYQFGTELYGFPKYEFVAGQEGEAAGGSLYSPDDGMYNGGCLLPGSPAGYSFRGPNLQPDSVPQTTTLATLSLRPGMLPEPTAYASGIDTVNLELDADAPEGLTYAIYSKLEPGEGDTPVLEGAWPSDSRTLTMTWDYRTPFTLRLTLGEEIGDASWTYNALGRSVMLHGKGYWYLYGSQCYTGTYESEEQTLVTEDPAVVFLHMMDGKLLDEAGNIWDAQAGAVSGPARTAFQLLNAKPVWSGQVSGLSVRSYGTYLVSETADGPLTKESSMVSRGGELYILQNAKPYSCLVDKQDPDHPYQTYLQNDGTLKDYFTQLKYPEGFRQNGIRELADNLSYTAYKPIALVRYSDGTLTAFDYTTGETIPVMSSTPSVSLMDYMAEKFQNFSLMGLISGVTSGEGLRGVAYESEVADNASLRTALANLSGNEENTTPTDGEGSGVYGDVPGGLDGAVTSEGVNADNGLGDVTNEGQTVVEGEGTIVEGEAVNGGGTVQDGETAEGSGVGQDGEPMPDGLTQTDKEGNPESGDPEKPDGEPEPEAGGPAEPDEETQPETDGPAEPDEESQPEADGPAQPDEEPQPEADGPAQPDEEPQPEADGPAEPDEEPQPEADGPAEPDEEPQPEPGNPAQSGGEIEPEQPDSQQEMAISVANRYVTVYDKDKGGSAVYDLEEYLSKPDEELVSQEERAEELQELGFHTTLARKEQLPQEQASGLLLMCAVAGGTVALLVCMSLLKKRKLDSRDGD